MAEGALVLGERWTTARGSVSHRRARKRYAIQFDFGHVDPTVIRDLLKKCLQRKVIRGQKTRRRDQLQLLFRVYSLNRSPSILRTRASKC